MADAFAAYERSRRPRADRIVRLSKRARLTRPPGVATSVVDRLGEALPPLRVDRALRGLASVAGYRAGVEAAGAARRARLKR